jgi:hypothetical protein
MHFVSKILFMSLLSSAPAVAEQGRLIDESKTGIVWGDLDCKIESHRSSEPRFSVDTFDYLYATVTISSTCVTRDGLTFTSSGEDSVPFLVLNFDWRAQAWFKGDQQIAKRRGDLVQTNPDLDFLVWTDGQETHTAFRVEARKKPNSQQ